MQKIIYSLVLGSLILLLPACNKFTDITPKGKNILNRVSDLDILLNYNFVTDVFRFEDANALTDVYPYVTNIPNLLSATSKGLQFALLTYDASIDRVTLAATDAKYEQLYAIINNVANIVLTNADKASGDRMKADQLKAEAYILRAYLHYILVNIYAKAYDPATAATDGGIPYVMDNDITTPNKKNTVAEVYTNLLADIDAAFQLNALPDKPVNNMRIGKGFAYAVKANVLLSMRNYPGALEAAEASLAISSSLADYRKFLKSQGGVVTGATYAAAENLFYASYAQAGPVLQSPTMEVMADAYEPGSIIRDSAAIYIANPISALPGSKIWYTTTISFGINTGGLTTSDMYLVKAESLARTQKVPDAMTVINYIRERRVAPYIPVAAATEAQAMTYIMRTARTEHLYTYKNFMDIKRWNAEGTYKQTLKRTISGKTYELKPESPLWIFPFPQSATAYNTNLTQNY
ncbi:RagB/SusD family nutrient uptake outer membrane protein [Chitinophaga sp. SYP-B3965]|uniref:RagB/SusD family nutrient uptake outer membrane protein n=1 Tax=Chitinophaga sp. SYP-B3965 TaxID=2663120 RepID=UPI00129A05A0|nr:RagB/SusD family nutrient uptake outer membrane protein [Chitinophaga sp. SYP-B3965]MRG45041.1 RagB/SusD family nutrient uptake outer membrane protein [Chitinophaga sp. SYP-B3965]